MVMTRNVTAVLALWMGIVGCSYANMLQMSLDDAVRNAQEKSRRGELSRIAVEYAEAQYQQARSVYQPVVELLGYLQRRDDAVSFTYPALNFAIQTPLGPVPVQTTEQQLDVIGETYGGLELKATLPLYTGGQRKSVVRQADLARSIAKKGVNRTSADLAFDVRKYYFGAQLARAKASIVDESVADLEAVERITRAFFEGGSDRVDRGDLLRSRMSADMARGIAVQIEGGYETAITALTHGAGFDWTDRIEPDSNEFLYPRLVGDLPDLVSQAERFNPEIATLRLAIDVADAELAKTRAARRPVVALTGSIMRAESDLDGGLTNGTNRNSWTIGVAVSMPLYDGGLRQNRVEAAAIDKRRGEVQEKEVTAQVAASLRAMLIEANRANRSLEVAERSHATSVQYHDLMLRAFQQGAKELEDVLTAQFMKTLNAMSVTQAKHDVAMASSAIARLVGTLASEN